MKLSKCAVAAYVLYLAHAELICREGIGCYDSQFVPSHEWQIVKEGQSIPPGLHVRLNLETGLQEAKFLDEDDDDDNVNNVAVVVDPEEISEQPVSNKPFKKSKVDEGELVSFSSSVKEVLDFDKERDLSRLDKALDTLIDLSHDIEFGAELTEDKNIFKSMKGIAILLKDDSPDLVEKVFRVMGSSLRNNEHSIKNFLVHQPLLFVDEIYDLLNDSSLSDTIHKRILGVVQALSSYAEYARVNFNLEKESTSSGVQKLISSFPNLGKQAQERLVQIFEDLDIPGFAEGNSGASAKMAAFLQLILVNEKSKTEDQFKSAMRSLVNIYEKEDLSAPKDFLHWLSKEVEERRTGLKKKSILYSGADTEFDSFLSSARHAVFGNPNARKMDEL